MSAQRRFSPLALTLAFCLSLTLPLTAQMLGGLEGVVKDFDGKPLVGATLEIERTDVKANFEVKTGKKGYYLHGALPSGMLTRYTIRIIYNGQKLHELTGINIPVGERVRLDIDLQQERKRQERGEGLTEQQKQQLEELRKRQEKTKGAQEHFSLGQQLTQQKQYPEAITELEAAAALDPNQWAIHSLLAECYVATNQNDKAIAAYQKAIELNPTEPALYNNLGGVYAKMNRLDDARKQFETAARLDPEGAATNFYNLGVTFYNQGDLKSAIEPLRKATELDPSRADAFYWLGVCLYSTAETKIEGNEVKTILPPGTRESFERYLVLEPNGKHANDAKAMLEAMGATVPTAVRVKKK